MEQYATLLELLAWRSERQADQTAYVFLVEDGSQVSLTYGELDRRARLIAARLKALGIGQATVLLLYPPGLEYIAALFGCLYAGAIAVPLYPPMLNRSAARLRTIIADAQPRIAITTSYILSTIRSRLVDILDLARLDLLATDDGYADQGSDYRRLDISGDRMAIIQYTSGSTTTPRGVMLTHGNLLHNSAFIYRAMKHGLESRGVSWLPPYHDMGLIGGILQPLYGGFPVMLMSPMAFLRSPYRWLQAISQFRATTSGGPNFAFDLCVRRVTPEQLATLDLSCWDVAFNGSEPVRAETLERFATVFGACGFRRSAFYPCYGLAESTLLVTGGEKLAGPIVQTVRVADLEQHRAVAAQPGSMGSQPLVGCGRSPSEQQLRIVDPQSLRVCPDGQVGEIWVSSLNVAQGYWNQAETTAYAFQAYPVGTGAGPFLRTGDLGFVHDGELFVTGRLKDIIIIRGRNYYPQDIEYTVEQSHPALRPGCGAAFSVDVAGEERLVVAQELEHRWPNANTTEIAATIRRSVAELHELDVYAVLLLRENSIPKTTSGKIQRYACRAGFLGGTLNLVASSRHDVAVEASAEQPDEGQLSRAVLLACSATERRMVLESYICGCVARVLRRPVEQLYQDTPLTAMGLDSLMAVELKNQIETDLGLLLPMPDLLRSPSIMHLAAGILDRLSEFDPKPEIAINAVRMISDEYPLSHGQRALWFIHQLAPESTAYHIVGAARIWSALDIPNLRRSFQDLIAHHATLRTCFPTHDGEPVQRVRQRGDFDFHLHDAAGWSETELREHMSREAAQPFDLEAGPLLRVAVFSRSREEHALLLVVHHIVADLWSMTLLVHELGMLYAAESSGAPISLPPLPVQYTDFVYWQNEQMAGEVGQHLWRYWQQYLSDAPQSLDLPTDRPRPPIQTYRGATHTFTVDADITQQLKQLAKDRNATMYMVLLATLLVLLHHYTGQEDILIGSPTTGRNRSELADLIGYFVNPVVLRVDLSRNPTFDDLLKRVRHHVLAAFEHQDYPFPLLAERLQLERNVARSPRFQVMFVWQKAHLIKEQGLTAFALSQEGVQMDLGGLRIEPIMLTQQAAQFDLTLTMAEVGDGLAAALQYNTDLFDHSTVARMAGHFKVLLRDIAGTPHRHVSLLRLLTSAERHQLLLEWNDTRSGYPANSCIHQLFEEQAERTPEADALIYNGDRLSYRDLNGRANQLAHALRCLGVGSEVRVGICVEPSHEMIIGVLGILKAGGTYVPLDPISPPERLRYMLENAGAAVLLTHERLRSQLPAVGIPTICLDTAGADIARERADNLSSSAISAHLSHVIYTSGSTGRPKGVMVAHSSVVNLWAAIDQAIYAPFARRRLRGCLIAPLSFDGSIREYLLLLRGHTLIIAPQEFRRNGEALLAYLRDNAVDEFYCTPSQLQLLIAAGLLNQTEYAPALVLLGGEQIQAPLWQLLAKQQRTVYYNIYGPTECTVDSTLTRITGGPARPTIGRPLGNVESYILDRQLNPTPIGVPGELYIGGHGLARGYINDPQQTAEKFIPHPFSADAGARLYRTGDLARYLPDGNIDFLGRVDHLIKIRGFSIEPGEIEAAICAHPAVRTATVVAHGVDGAELQVVAYFVPVPDAPLTITELRAFLKEHLPYYMLPVAFVPLDSLPVTANGKVDYRALPPLDQARTALGVAYQSPGNTVEAMLAEIWGKVLGIDQIGVQDNFFDLGGSSLSIVRVRALIAQQLGVDIPIVKLFHYPTIQSLAEYILREQEPGTPHLERSRSIAARRLQRLSLRKAPGE